MKFKFPDHATAEGFAYGIGCPTELDIAAFAEGDEVDVLGLDDHETIAPELKRIAAEMGGILCPEEDQ